MKKIHKEITHNKKLLIIAALLIVITVTGSAYGLAQLTKSKPHAVASAAVKVNTSAKKATELVVQTPTPTTNAQPETTQSTKQSTSITPRTSQSGATTKCDAGEILTQEVEAGDYNEGLSIRSNGISTINDDINYLQTLIAGLSTNPPSTTQQNVNNELIAIQNTITNWNNQISQENSHITQQQDISAGDLATNCPSLTLVTEHQLVPALPGYTEGSTWNP